MAALCRYVTASLIFDNKLSYAQCISLVLSMITGLKSAADIHISATAFALYFGAWMCVCTFHCMTPFTDVLLVSSGHMCSVAGDAAKTKHLL